MKYTFFIIAFCTFVLIQCTNNNNPYTITNGKIGTLTSQTTIKQLKTVFMNDSIVPLSNSSPDDALQGEVEVFSKRWQQNY